MQLMKGSQVKFYKIQEETNNFNQYGFNRK